MVFTKKYVSIVLILILSSVNIFLFQNCQQHAEIGLTADMESLSAKVNNKNSFFINKNSLGEDLAPILQTPAAEDGSVQNSNYVLEIQNDIKLPMILENGTVTKIDSDSIFFVPKKDFVGLVEFTINILIKLEAPAETLNAQKGADGKSYIVRSESLIISVFVHDHILKQPDKAAEETPKVIKPVELDKTPPTEPEKIEFNTKFDSDSSSPIIKWTDGYDEGTGIDFYEIAIGTQACGDDVVAWKNVGFKNQFQMFGKFELSKKYYPSIRTVDFRGQRSEPKCGDSWLVQSTFLPFVFNNLTGVGLAETITSNAIKLSGDLAEPQTAICTGCLISRNNGPFQAQVSGFVVGDTITLQLTSSKGFNTESLVSIKFGSLQIPQWSVKTTAPPTAIKFTNVNDASVDTIVPSDFAMLLGVKVPIKYTLSGDGNPQLSIKGSGKWSSSGTLNPNDVFQIQMKSAPTLATEVKSTLVLGDNVEVPWAVKTFLPAGAFAFKNLEAVPMNSEVLSDVIMISGLTKAVDVTISGNGSPKFSIDGGTWLTTGKINPNQKLQLKVTSESKVSAETVVTIKVGTTSSLWSIKTTTSISPFSIPAVTNASKGADITSSSVPVSGFSAALKFTLTGDGSPMISFDGGSWMVSGQMPATTKNIQLKLRTGTNAGIESKATLTFEGASPVVWSVITSSKVDPFTFPEMDPQPLNQAITSSEVTVSGSSFKSEVSMTISGDGSPCFMINNGPCSTTGSIKPNDKLKLKANSKTTLNATSNVKVTFGTGADVSVATWTFTTSSGPTGKSIVNTAWSDVKTEVESEGTLDLTGYTTNKFTFKVTATIDDMPSSSLNAKVSVDNGSTWVTSGTLPVDASIMFKMTTGTNYTDYYKKSMKVVFAIDGIPTKWTWTVNTIPAYNCATVPTAYLVKQTFATGIPSISHALSYSNGIVTCNSYRNTFPLSAGAIHTSAYPGKLPTGAFVTHFYNDGSENTTQDTDRCQSGKMVCSDDRWPFDNSDANGNIVSGFCMCK